MNASTLVLNQSYEAINRIHWLRALIYLWDGKAELIEHYENKVVHSVSAEFKVPSVIRFLNYVKQRKRRVKFSRENLYARDRGMCQYCGKHIPRREFTLDHVHPKSQSGKTVWENIVVACIPCNLKKGGRTPEQAKMHLLRLPAKAPTAMVFFAYENGMPEGWAKWLGDGVRDFQYWNSELENDNK